MYRVFFELNIIDVTRPIEKIVYFAPTNRFIKTKAHKSIVILTAIRLASTLACLQFYWPLTNSNYLQFIEQ